MKNVDAILSQKYFQLLQAQMPTRKILPDYAPYDLVKDVDAYVVVTYQSSSDASTMQSDDTVSTIVISIYTRTTADNNSDDVNDIADNVFIVFNSIKANPAALLTPVQVLSIELAGDDKPQTFDTGSQLFINRFIRFQHKIFHSLN